MDEVGDNTGNSLTESLGKFTKILKYILMLKIYIIYIYIYIYIRISPTLSSWPNLRSQWNVPKKCLSPRLPQFLG